MKKYLILLLIILPVSVYAKTYDIIDSTIDVDDNKYIVITRDNVKANTDLAKMNLTEETMTALFDKNSSYMDAFIISEEDQSYKELIIAIKDTDLEYNLHVFKEKQIKELEDEMIKGYEVFEHGIYTNNTYKYVYMYYTQLNNYIMDYYTVINGKGYTFKYQSNKELSEEDRNEFKDIINSISFRINDKYEFDTKPVIIKYIVYVVLAAIAGGVAAVIKVKSNKKKL